MQRFFLLLCSLLTCLFTTNPLAAIALKDKQEANNDLRILGLLPKFSCSLAVDPAIPEDFVALSHKETLDLYNGVYWGPEHVLKAFFENPRSLETSIIRVKLSTNVVQTGANSFSDEGSVNFPSVKGKWGDYPIRHVNTKMGDLAICMAWVGLNDPGTGWTLLFNLEYPYGEGHPNKEDRELWNNFIQKTTQLKDGDYFKARGQDLQEGYTLVNVSGAKLKMIAEKREGDGLLQIVVIPEDSGIEFHYIDMVEGFMGASWKYGEPIVKVHGEVVEKRGNATNVTNCFTTIFFKTVPEFSFQQKDGKEPLIFQKVGDKIDPS